MLPDPERWLPPPANISWGPSHLHLWSFGLDQAKPITAGLETLLSASEKATAHRLRVERDRRRYIVAHGRLRQILSRYTATAPEHLTFSHGAHGKPFLSKEHVDNSVHFNLSRSQAMGLCAVAYGQEVGADVECVRPFDGMETLVNRFFSPLEQADWLHIEESRRLEAFYRYWTCKEAFVKARGEGLSLPLNQFDVAFPDNAPPRLVRVPGDPAEAAGWFVQTHILAPGYRAAVVLPGLHWQVDCWRWLESD
ncbi:MAG TPA: 4'-phosphopantetheinyl transferase superfamily protein [Anaerolineales bacterium]|nr:4'-phosphopantetheinyl transferase superfamily protein [Anaerolineales bacterium]